MLGDMYLHYDDERDDCVTLHDCRAMESPGWGSCSKITKDYRIRPSLCGL